MSESESESGSAFYHAQVFVAAGIGEVRKSRAREIVIDHEFERTFEFPDGVTEGSPVKMLEHHDGHKDWSEGDLWAKGVVRSFEQKPDSSYRACISWDMQVEKFGGGEWSKVPANEFAAEKTYEDIRKGGGWSHEEICKADEFMVKVYSCIVIQISSVDIVDDHLRLAGSTLSGDEFKLIFPVGTSVEEAGPEILTAVGGAEEALVKLVMPNGDVLEAGDVLRVAWQTSAAALQQWHRFFSQLVRPQDPFGSMD
mmetsp:Transcript_85862/g.152037  ORF Transcript_85862/g.152037 Transcript_85862/m.152037 type:complete len:254 (-) Transcript_85862:334-1095(-)